MPKCTEYQFRTAHHQWIAIRWTPEGLLVHREDGGWEIPAPDKHGIARAMERCNANAATAQPHEIIGCVCPNVQPRTAPPTWPEGDARDAAQNG